MIDDDDNIIYNIRIEYSRGNDDTTWKKKKIIISSHSYTLTYMKI